VARPSDRLNAWAPWPDVRDMTFLDVIGPGWACTTAAVTALSSQLATKLLRTLAIWQRRRALIAMVGTARTRTLVIYDETTEDARMRVVIGVLPPSAEVAGEHRP
jgi:hypothetical protein